MVMPSLMQRIFLLLVFLSLTLSSVRGETAESPTPPPVEESAEPKTTPGVALATGITEITGVAISPLLGVSAVGSYTWFRTPANARANLAWYCQPWAWGTGFVILALCFTKDSLGAAAPGVLKKPFDLAELLENKASALVAGTAFVPLVATEMARAMKPVEIPTAMIGGDFVAVLDAGLITVPLAMVAFGLVWLCSHAVNVLIILSPFSSLDTLLKIGRTAMIASVAVAYAIAPWLGAALCLVILAAAIWLAPAALRLMIFGSRFAGDMVLRDRGRRRARIERPHVFTLAELPGVPLRTGGWIERKEDGGIDFHYRRFVFGPVRSVPVPGARMEIAKGVLMPVIVHVADGKNFKSLILLPRYRGREEEIREHFHLAAVRDHAWARGWSAIREAWRSLTAGRVRQS
ncbi:MAG: hypothetical protein MUF31_09395 [Akkermansiaceae bacterium]|nr:hypothetical protein [Akkermansiaceae bacterium]